MSERTAERTANETERTRVSNAGLLQRQCTCGQHTHGSGECSECKKKRFQRQLAGRHHSPPVSTPPGVDQAVNGVLRSAGRPLDAATRAYMEPRFGQDFSQVRVHTGSQAAESARAVGALAYSVGQNLVFAQGQYAPGTQAGRKLLAHELAHTIQQGGSSLPSGALRISQPGDRQEVQAEAQARRVASGLHASTTFSAQFGQTSPSTPVLQRQADISQAPDGLPCILIENGGHTPGTDIFFDVSSNSVPAAEQADIKTFVDAWKNDGSTDDVIVDGWASTDGPQPLNWTLSCERAEAVKTELEALGVPADKITTAGHGETDEFSSTDPTQNRRAIITRSPVLPPPSPTPPAPTPPAPAPPAPGPAPAPAPPAPGPNPPAPAPPAPAPAITSQTVEAKPDPRNRTTIGVGEEVNLETSAATAAWATNAGTLSSAAGKKTKLTAPDRAQKVTVTADAAKIEFDVIEPSSVHMDRFPGTGVKHTKDRPDSGIHTEIFIGPDTVNFSKIQHREVDVGATADGVYAPFNGVGHDPAPATIGVSSTVEAGKGTKSNGRDCIYSGDPGTAAPFAAGSITFNIPMEFKVGAGTFKRFTTVAQVSSLAADLTTLTSSKAGASGTKQVADATEAIAACP